MPGRNLSQKRRNAQAYLDAVFTGDLETVERLLDAGVPVDTRDPEHDETALMLALRFKQDAIARLLLARGADVNARQREGRTPITDADISMLSELRSAGADIQAADSEGMTVLMKAIERVDTEKVKWLIRNGADITAKDEDGRTALDYAMDSVLLEIMALLQKGKSL